MLRLPSNLKDSIELADWLELSALEANDKNASIGDLFRALQIGRNDEADEELAQEIMRELEHREKAAGEGYPFLVHDARVVQANPKWEDRGAYVFCLCLSYFRWKPELGAPINPWHLFEDLSCLAAAQYLQGQVFKFGSQGQSDFMGFGNAIRELCRQIGEGEGFKQQPTLKRKDDKVDLVAWKDFHDKMPGKLIMFGQCAAGDNWDKKVDELQPQRFWDQWMAEAKTSPLIRSFYIPHRIPRDRWQYYARSTGILFDRCRIAYWAWRANQTVLADPRYLQWCQSVLPDLRQ
jgi:hypothetical protein